MAMVFNSSEFDNVFNSQHFIKNINFTPICETLPKLSEAHYRIFLKFSKYPLTPRIIQGTL